MTTITTAELDGAALDWAVAHAQGLTTAGHFICVNERGDPAGSGEAKCIIDLHDMRSQPFSPSRQWDEGGPIIDRERIGTFHYESDEAGQPCDPGWAAFIHWERKSYGPTPLIAAMRAYVAHKLGATVEVPQELLV